MIRRPPITRQQVAQALDLLATNDAFAVGPPAPTLTRPRPAPRQQPERDDAVHPILDYLAAQKIWRRRVFLGGIPLAGGHRAANPLRGMGDILALLPGGRAWSIECKSSTGQQRRSQVAFEAAWVASGGLYTLARSVDPVRAVWEALGAAERPATR